MRIYRNILFKKYRRLYTQLTLLLESENIDEHVKEINSIIEIAGNYLLYGEKNNEPFFDTFCELKFMDEYLNLVDNVKNQEINLQIVKTFAFLIPNLKDEMTIYFIFSNNFINHIISNINFFEYGEDFLTYYINFLKSLSQKLNQTTIQFFFHKELNSLPLLENAIKLYNNPDSMLNNVVNNIFLSICKLEYEPIEDYFCSLPSIAYFTFISCKMRDMIIALNEEKNYERFINLQDDIITHIIYIQDIFSLQKHKINYVLTNCLMYYTILPLIVNTISSIKKQKITIELSVYILSLFFNYIKNENFLNVLFTVVFLPKRNKGLLKYIENYPNNAKNYYYNWEAQKKQTFNSFQEYISNNFSAPFLKSLVYMKHSVYEEVREIATKCEKLCDKDENYNPASPSFLNTITNDVLQAFSNSEFNIMSADHKIISKATGVHCGMSTKDIKYCIIKKIKNFYNKFFEINGKKNINLIDNETRDNLFSFLSCKDDTLVLLTNVLLFEVLKKNDEGLINEKLRKAARLMSCEQLTKEEFEQCLKEEDDDIFEYPNEIKNSKKNVTSKSMVINNENVDNVELDLKEIKISDIENKGANNSSVLETKQKNEQLKVSLKEFVEKNNKEGSKIVDSSSENQNALLFENYNNIYFDNINSKNKIVYKYEEKLVSLLCKLLSPFAPFRPVTIKIIFENLRKILLKNSPNSKNKKISIISQKDKAFLELIYGSFLTEIVKTIEKHQTIKEKSYFFFELMFEEYSKEINLKPLLEKEFLIIPFDINDEGIEDIPKSLQKINQDNYTEVYKIQLLTFICLHDFLLEIEGESGEKLIKNKFPIGNEDMNLNEQIILTDLGIEIEKYECKIKLVKETSKNFSESIIIIDDIKLYIGNLSSNSNYIRFKKKFLLSECNIEEDRGEPRLLHLIIVMNDGTIKDENSLDLLFNETENANLFKRNLSEHINYSKIKEQCYFSSFFDDLLEKFQKTKK